MNNYSAFSTSEHLMGPSSLRILSELFSRHAPLLTPGTPVLDLGCGKGLTSMAIAEETPAQIFAADLWIPAEENRARFESWGIAHRVTPVHADANDLPFDREQFQGLVSVDAYHYFATGKGFFQEKILPYLKSGAQVWIGIPGIKDAFAGQQEALLSPWLGEDAHMFQSPMQWQDIIGTHPRMEALEVWKMDCFDSAWQDWLATGSKYALGDKTFFDSLIRPYTCFVGIYMQLK